MAKCSIGLRDGRITGSNFKNCCVSNIDDQKSNKSSPIRPRPKHQVSDSKQKKAIEQYKKVAVSKHEGFVYGECGLIINPDLPYFIGSS